MSSLLPRSMLDQAFDRSSKPGMRSLWKSLHYRTCVELDWGRQASTTGCCPQPKRECPCAAVRWSGRPSLQPDELVGIKTDEIKAAFAKNCVETVKADYTNEDEEITKWLKMYNRPGVPMYLIIPAGKPDGVITLPDLLTKSAILDGLKTSGPSNDCAG